MSEDLRTAIIVLVVGMTTVFVILFLVVLTGNTLIRLVNRFSPIQVVKPERNQNAAPLTETSPTGFHGAKLAAIVSAVQIVTKGQGNIQKIEKLTSNEKRN